MRTGFIKYEWLEDNTIIDYHKKVIEMNDNQFADFCQFLEQLDMTPRMSLTDIAHEIFDYNSYYIKVNEENGARYYNYNVCGELVRYVAPNGDYYDRYELNPDLITNMPELQNLIY